MQVLDLDMSKPVPVVIGATGMTAIRQNIRMILLTLIYSIPLDRGFAHDGRILDSPAPLEAVRRTGRIVKAIEKYEPRVKVHKLEWPDSDLAEGRLMPKITFSLRPGADING